MVLQRVFINSLNRRGALAVLKHVRHSSTAEHCYKSSIPDVQIPNVHLIEYVMKDFGKWHDKIALECGFTGRKYTYEDLRIKSTNLNKSLRKKLKLQKEDTVALLLPNIPEFPICIYGALLAGLRVTTINPTYTSEEIHRQLVDANVKAVITIGPLWNNVKTATNNAQGNIPIVLIKEKVDESLPQGAINFKELSDEICDIADVPLANPNDTLFLPYSSGTTGLPKGVELSSRTLISNLAQLDCPELRITRPPTENERDCMPALLPMFHIYGFTVTVLYSIRAGTKLITLPKFTPEKSYIETIVRHKPNILMLVPPIVIFLYAHPAVKTEYFKNLTATICGAAPLGALDEVKFREKVNRKIDILQGYGLSEASPVVTMIPKHFQGKHMGSIGHPLPNTSIKIVNPDDPLGTHLGSNKTGELLVKGPQCRQLFFIADRIKELIKVNAFQVPPAELEDIIRDYPGVADAAVIGIPHPAYGEVPRAYVVAKQGNQLDSDGLMRFVEKKVAKHKKLRGGVSVVDNIPKNASGKIMRRQIKQLYEEKGI
ncbi:AMP-binding enzyme [Popillia japonica]|uniref:AMP-binding enzyme n=1 Tax=Popillia japonica TaxID=7064 RepID=A0AAW1LX47_POPJA